MQPLIVDAHVMTPALSEISGKQAVGLCPSALLSRRATKGATKGDRFIRVGMKRAVCTLRSGAFTEKLTSRLGGSLGGPLLFGGFGF